MLSEPVATVIGSDIHANPVEQFARLNSTDHTTGPNTGLSITGSARIVEGGAPELLTELAEAMIGSSEHFPPHNSPPGLLTRIRIEKLGGASA